MAEPLFGLFAVCDDVFTEDDAFNPEKLRVGFGRIYREYRKCRAVLEHDAKRFAPSGLPAAQRGSIHAEGRETH